MQLSGFRMPAAGLTLAGYREILMPTRTKQKKAIETKPNKAKPKRSSVSFQKEAWYAAAAARFSAARPHVTKGASSH
jgi:hypothetical protein